MAGFIGAGTLAGNATVTPQAISSHASTAIGDILIAQIINKSSTANVVSPPDGTWTKLVEGTNLAGTVAHRHQYTLFWKIATVAGAQSYTFTKATDDNVLFAGVISTFRTIGGGLDPTAVGITVTTAATDNVSFPAFDPAGVCHVIYFAWYGLNATTFGAMAGTNPTCTTRYDLESATGTACTLAATSGDSDPSNITIRTWASASTTDAGNTGVVLALSDAAPPVGPALPLARRLVAQAGGVSGPIVVPSVSGTDDIRFASSQTRLNVRQGLLYRSLTSTITPLTVTDTVSVTQASVVFTGKTVTPVDITSDTVLVGAATVTFTGKPVTVLDTEPITKADVLFTGQTVSIGDATQPGSGDVQFASTQTRLNVRQGLLYRSLTAPPRVGGTTDTTTVTQATVVYAGKTVTIRDTEVTPVLKATITVTGKTVTVRESEVTPVAKATVTVFGKPITEFGLIPVNKATVVFAGQTVALVDPGVDRVIVDKADVLFTGQTVTLVDREVLPVLKGTILYTGRTVTALDFGAIDTIPVGKADILFSGQTVVVTDTGEFPIQPPIGGGGGVVPPWIVYGRKHRRRYRALEEIERRLDKRIETLKTETKKTQEKVAEVLGQTVVPDLFAELLRQQALITGMLLEAQRRAEAVRQERIQLAILAQRAAEAIDEEEAITMLLLT